MSARSARVRRAVRSFYGKRGPVPDAVYMAQRTVQPEALASAAERQFLRLCSKRGHGPIVRSGWPDFLVVLRSTRPIGVEVKSDNDLLSRTQVACFSMLEHIGLPVFVWWARRPDVLMPWRRFWEATGRQLRADEAGTSRVGDEVHDAN